MSAKWYAPAKTAGAKGGVIINRVILMGRLARDPEVRTTQSGRQVARMTIAVDRPRAKDGTQAADFPGLVAWEKTAEFAEKYLYKGQRILVEGRLQTGSYEAQDGTKRYTTDVICERIEFADGKRDGQGDAARADTPADAPPGFSNASVTDDDIPF